MKLEGDSFSSQTQRNIPCSHVTLEFFTECLVFVGKAIPREDSLMVPLKKKKSKAREEWFSSTDKNNLIAIHMLPNFYDTQHRTGEQMVGM